MRKRKKCWPGYVAKGTKNSPSGKRTKNGKLKREKHDSHNSF